ncbi:MAG: FAD-dependent oxidoreductase [Minisyncoccia bacterium]|jgi:alkyl hydroperoxide reductase subunit F
MYDLIIIGGGPGGVAAGVYAARKKIKTLLITDGFGGQSAVSGEIQNWIGTKSISGYDLAKSLEEHLRAQEDITVIDDDLAVGVQKKDGGFSLSTRNGKAYEARYLLLASGSRRKKLGVPGEKEFDGKGVVYCSICDAPLFKDKTVAVVGSGNSALEAVIDLLSYAAKIYLVVRSEASKGDPVTQDKVKNDPKVTILLSTVVEQIRGKDFVAGVHLKNVKTGEEKELPLDGVFVEIGLLPNSDFVKELVKLDERGHVVVDARTQATSCEGIWAVGDVTDVLYRQNNISAGDAVKAVLNIYDRIKKQ